MDRHANRLFEERLEVRRTEPRHGREFTKGERGLRHRSRYRVVLMTCRNSPGIEIIDWYENIETC